MNISEYLSKDTLDTDTIVRATVVIDFYLLEPLYKADFYMHYPSDVEDFLLTYDDVAAYALTHSEKFKKVFEKIYESLGLPAAEEYISIDKFMVDFINVRFEHLLDDHCVIDHDGLMVITREGHRELLHLQHKMSYLEKEADMEKQMEQIGSMFSSAAGPSLGIKFPFDFKDNHFNITDDKDKK